MFAKIINLASICFLKVERNWRLEGRKREGKGDKSMGEPDGSVCGRDGKGEQ